MTQRVLLYGFSLPSCLANLTGRLNDLVFFFCRGRCLPSRLQTAPKNYPASLVLFLRVHVLSFQSEGEF